MSKALLVVATAVLLFPSVADACLNGVELTTDDYARMVARAEKQLEAGQFGKAKKSLGHEPMPTAALERRAADIRAVLKLRMSKSPKQLEAAAKHFKARSESKQGEKDVRMRAWLAEALVALGKQDDARPILVELHERDLVPDGYAYLALAKLSTGAQRYEFWKACRTRAKNKDICELPAQVSTKSAARS
ncbi:MAG TPA: hypothetical protein VIV11_20720 [Kofleriaceae bacterium]